MLIDISQKRINKWPTVHEKTFNITSYRGNTNQNHEVSSHTYWNDYRSCY